MLVKMIIHAAIAAILIGSAAAVYAQGKGAKGPDATPMQLDEQAKQRDRDNIDRQYRSTLQKTGGATTAARPEDPWANMRGSEDVKPKR